MNKAYIITYDLSNPGQRYEALLKKIKAYPKWARLGGSSYIIVTPQDHVQIRDNLKTVLDRNDKIFVSIVKAPAAWYNLGDEVSQWLNNNLN